jgi:hypothetical protein
MSITTQRQLCENEIDEFKCHKIDLKDNLSSDEIFILARVLGHPEILGGNKWGVYTECFICERWVYSQFFYQPTNLNSSSSVQTPKGNNLHPIIEGSFQSLLGGSSRIMTNVL